MPEEVAEKVGGKVCTFGSFRLGVNSQGGDIDTLCIAPRHIERVDFFTSFAELLKKQREIQKFTVKFPHYVVFKNSKFYFTKRKTNKIALKLEAKLVVNFLLFFCCFI